MTFDDLDLWTLAWVGLAMGLLWLLSLLSGDLGVADIFWGIGHILIAVAAARSEAADARQLLAFTLVSIWGIRLALYLIVRSRGQGEDPRYRSMREKGGKLFGVTSLFTVFVFQGVGMWTLSLPVQAAVRSPTPRELTPLDLAGAAVWFVGFAIEAVADVQLALFKRKPQNAGVVMDRGLWHYSRHPNYFGDAVAWWGLGLIGLATGAWWSLAGPLVLTVYLMRVSGVPVERRLRQTRPAYAAYVECTSAFVPRPPKELARS